MMHLIGAPSFSSLFGTATRPAKEGHSSCTPTLSPSSLCITGAEVKPRICQVQSSFPHNNLTQHALHPGHLPPTNNHTQGVLCLEGRVRDVHDLHMLGCNNIFLRTQAKTLAGHFVLLLAQLNKFPALNICSCSFYVLNVVLV